MVLGKLDSHKQKNENGLLPHTIYKNKLKMHWRLKHRWETVKLLEDTGKEFLDISLGKFFLNKSKTGQTKKLLSVEQSKQLTEWRDSLQDGRKYLQTILPTGHYPEYIRK
jgi:hypothetical protein